MISVQLQLHQQQVHQRDVTRQLLSESVTEVTDFRWLCHLRFRTDAATASATSSATTGDRALTVHMADATFDYGFEYLGVGERLVQTPLTDRYAHVLTRTIYYCQCIVLYLRIRNLALPSYLDITTRLAWEASCLS
jgi:dynein heavy chain 1, cytosolic